MESHIQEFKKYHKNKFNTSFHVICSIIYMSLFLSLFKGNIGLYIYGLLLILLFPKYIMYILFLCLILSICIHYSRYICYNRYSSYSRFNQVISLGLILFFYLLPELSHQLTNEHTVLNIHALTFIDIIENFFLLPLYAFICLVSSYTFQGIP
jgi:hypothetical protein